MLATVQFNTFECFVVILIEVRNLFDTNDQMMILGTYLIINDQIMILYWEFCKELESRLLLSHYHKYHS